MLSRPARATDGKGHGRQAALSGKHCEAGAAQILMQQHTSGVYRT